MSRRVKERLLKVKRASDAAWKKLRPTAAQVREAVEKKSRKEMTKTKPAENDVSAERLYTARCEEEDIVKDMVTQ